MPLELSVGVDIGGTKIHFALVDAQGKLYADEQIPTEAIQGAAAVMERTLQGIERMLGLVDRMKDAVVIKGIGIGSAGQIDFASGSVAYAVDTLPGWTGMRIQARAEERFPDLPIIVDNDVNVMAVAELRCGAAKGLRHFICLALGTGIGGAVVENGRLVRGAFGGAGELGHVSVDFNGPQCSCGNLGCLELYASGSGIARLAKEEAASFNDSRAVMQAWLQGDAQASQLMNIAIAALASGISSLIHTFNPEAVIIGGGVAEAGDAFLSAIRRETQKRTSAAMWKAVELKLAAAGNVAGVKGAALQLWHYPK
ncbi:ROK family protein [Paenibacillus silvisoli]|uniref:ROK family protein n=1 Tax=Paenibacillus silvisoli TaxID=3110539 RepID=UPI0028057F38|nr:ROK family protein [Paenibacillus silvisoli]